MKWTNGTLQEEHLKRHRYIKAIWTSLKFEIQDVRDGTTYRGVWGSTRALTKHALLRLDCLNDSFRFWKKISLSLHVITLLLFVGVLVVLLVQR